VRGHSIAVVHPVNPPLTDISVPREKFGRLALAKFILGRSFWFMVALLTIEALLTAATTYLIIRAGRDVANDDFLTTDLIMIFVAQSTAYIVGAISWIYAERAGFGAFGKYMQRFARDNRHQTRLLHERGTRETVEPFLTGETFHIFFQLTYELEADLKLALHLLFNTIVIGSEIDGSFPVAYGLAFTVLIAMQIMLRKPVARAFLENQRQTNRMTAQGYTAWDNVFAGNRYNLRLWLAGFKERLRDALRAQIWAIMTREGLSSASGIIGLGIIFVAIVMVAVRNTGDMEVLVVLAATLPRQIEMTKDMYSLASGWNDMVAIWARLGGVVDNMRPDNDPGYNARIKYDWLILREGDQTHHVSSLEDALALVYSKPNGRINVRGRNGAGKSTVLAALKAEIKNRAYYWPTTDRLAFKFAEGIDPEGIEEPEIDPELLEEAGETAPPPKEKKIGFSSGERQLKSLQEITRYTEAAVYLFDEWDANLDTNNRALADELVAKLAQRARVIEISHRDRA
jgi:ABC-type multidrug transport system fused ATPase/permease subunit